MKQYKIRANEELFNRWISLIHKYHDYSHDIRGAASIVQNDMILSMSEVNKGLVDIMRTVTLINDSYSKDYNSELTKVVTDTLNYIKSCQEEI